MRKHKRITTLLIGSLALSPVVTLTGCETMQENPRTSGAVIGGVGGAAAGALLGGRDSRLLGALIGGALGAGGGYLIGSSMDKANHRDDAIRADRRAREYPVTPEEARNAPTADINGDGYVTMDEVVAMRRAGLTDQEMIDRLKATNQFFELTPQQENYLRDHGVSNRVVLAMRDINRDLRDRAYARYNYEPPREDRVGQP